MSEISREEFFKKYEQRSQESILQFVSNIDPKSAAEFITGVHQANELVASLKTNTLIITQRGGTLFDWSMKEFDRLLDRKELKTIYLPIGTQRDISRPKAMKIPSIEEKVQIAQQVFSKSIGQNENLGNITFVEEVKSGGSLAVFLNNILPLLANFHCESFNLIAMIDRGSSVDLNRTFLENLREEYGIQIHEVPISLKMSDKRSLVDELVYDPNKNGQVPEVIDNKIIKSMVRLLTIAALHPNELSDLLQSHIPPASDLKAMHNLTTEKLSQPEYINKWLSEYQKEISQI
jgi:hypothetical protein